MTRKRKVSRPRPARPLGSKAQPAMAPTIAERVRRQIADDIMSGSIPPGTKLEEEALARRFQASRTPVREALRQLHATGLVGSRPRRGFIVTAFGSEQLGQLYETVGELEALAARLAAQRMSLVERKQLEVWLARLEEATAASDGEAYVRCSDELHGLIHRGTRNPFLADMVRSYRLRVVPFRTRQSYSAEHLVTSLEEHRRIVGAIVAHDGDEASRAMHSHVATSVLRALETIQHHDATAADPIPAFSTA